MYTLAEIYKNPNVSISILSFDTDSCQSTKLKVKYRVGKQKKNLLNYYNIPVRENDLATAISLLNYYGGTLTSTSSDDSKVKNVYTTIPHSIFFNGFPPKDYTFSECSPQDSTFFEAVASRHDEANTLENIFFIREGFEFNFETVLKWIGIYPNATFDEKIA